MQKDYAKNSDADCTRHQFDYYEDLAATPKGLQELALLHCQFGARQSWHDARMRELQAGGGKAFKSELDKAIGCAQENVAIIKTMQKAGVTGMHC